ncbi:MAG: HEAT repeat domain-containing protein [Fibrobacterota bacterium]
MVELRRETIIESLKVLRSKNSLTHLKPIIPLLSHNDPEIRKEARNTLTEIVKTRLINDFNNMDKGVRKGLTKFLTSVNPDILKTIRSEIYSADVDKRIRAAQILSFIKEHKEAEKVLSDLMSDKDARVRATAIKSMAEHTGRSGMEIILSLLNDYDERVKANTLEALGAIKGLNLSAVLLRHKNSKSGRIKANVLLALFNSGHKKVNKELEQMMSSGDLNLIKSGMYFISKAAGREPRFLDSLLIPDYSHFPEAREKAIEILVNLGTPEADSYIGEILGKTGMTYPNEAGGVNK